MHLSDILPCTSSSAFDNDASELPSATTTMTSAGSETRVSSSTDSSLKTPSKKWRARARALSPIRVPKALRLWSNGTREQSTEKDDEDFEMDLGDLNEELPSPVIRVSSRPTEVCSPTPTWNRGGDRTLPSIDGMVFTHRGRALPSARTRPRPVSSIIPMSASARAMELQAFATESTLNVSSTISSRLGSFEEISTLRDVDMFGSPLTADEHAFDSKTFNVRVDLNHLTTCEIIRPLAETQGHHRRRLRKCLSVPRDLSRAFQSFSCIQSDDLDSPKEKVGYQGPKSASPQVTSFRVEKDEEAEEKVLGAATWASIFGLMEAPSKRRSAVFGSKAIDEMKIEHGQLVMPQVEITVTRAVFISEINDLETGSVDDSIEEIPRF